MQPISRNIAANFLSKALSSLALILCTPFYISNVGLEKFGLIGFYNTLVMIFSVLDFGFGTTLNRFLAQNHEKNSPNYNCKHLLISIELIYLKIFTFLFIFLVLFIPKYSTLWFNTAGISSGQLQNSVTLILLSTLLIWPINLYSNGLKGLQNQVLENGLFLGASITRHLGGVLVLLFWKGNIEYYFIWQAATNFVFLAIFRSTLRSKISPVFAANEPRFSFSLLKGEMNFSKNVFFLGLLSLTILQYDKITISKFTSLENFACYSTAATLATGMSAFLSTPLQNAFFPAFSRAISRFDKSELSSLTQRYAELLGGFFIPFSVIGFAFCSHFIGFIMPSPQAIQLTTTIFRLLTIGFCLNGISFIGVSILLSDAKTQLLIWINAIFVVVFIPLTIYAGKIYGYLPFCISWILLNASYLPILTYIVHKKYVTYTMFSSIAHTLIYPILCSTPFALVALLTSTKSFWGLVLVSFPCMLGACICSLMVSACGRQILRTCINAIFRMQGMSAIKKH
jgi:O-antigen/teichoic acid export membrane protein